MWKNYLKVAIRNSIKDKYYILINVLGLGVAMAFSLTIYLFHAYNIEFDNYYQDTENIVRLHCLKQDAKGEHERFELSPIAMAPVVADELAGIEDYTRFTKENDNLKYKEQIFSQQIAYADPNFFDFFKVKLKTGSHAALSGKNNIFLTEDLATKYFGDHNPTGEIMTIHYSGKRSVDFKVAGVFERIPLNSSFTFDALVPFDNFLYGQDIQVGDWSPWQQVGSYFKISSPGMLGSLNQSIKKYIAQQNEAREEWKVSNYQLITFKDASNLNQADLSGSQTNLRLRPEVLIVFTTLAILILLIVSFNLANTSMALMTRRVKEIGVRKAMGGSSRHIFTQFMFEMSWTSFLGLLVGTALFHWISQGFFAIWNMPYETTDVSFVKVVLAFIGLFAFAAIFSGLSPALFSKRLQPTSIFQSQVKLKRTNNFSRMLNALQFTISITLIIAGIVFTRNADFLKMLDMGYDMERVITIWVDNEAEYNGIKNKAESLASINSFAATNDHVGFSYDPSFLILDTGKTEIRSLRVGRDYLEVMGFKLAEGRFFDFDKTSDLEEAILVNQAYVDKFQVNNPIGEIVNLADKKYYIIGVTENIIDNVYRDFEAIPKAMIAAREEDCMTLIVKVRPNQEEEVFSYLEASWKELVDDRPFTGRYQDEVAMGYAINDNNNLRTIFMYMAFLGGFLSLTGIFALSSLNVSRRIKEIGIRKVLGASTPKIILLLNREFAITMAIAVLLGGTLGVFLSNQLLNLIYKFHISVGAFTVVLAAFMVVLAAFLTTSATIFSAANTNPSETLRDE